VRIAVSVPSIDSGSDSSPLPLLVRFPTGAPLPCTRPSASLALPLPPLGPTSPQPLLSSAWWASPRRSRRSWGHTRGPPVPETRLSPAAAGTGGGARCCWQRRPMRCTAASPWQAQGRRRGTQSWGVSQPPGGRQRVGAPRGWRRRARCCWGVFSRSTQRLQLLPLAQPTVSPHSLSLLCKRPFLAIPLQSVS